MDPLTLLIILVAIAVVVIIIVTNTRRRKAMLLPESQIERFNLLAILSFVFSFVISIVAIVLGHLALSQIYRTKERGWGLAMAGLIIGYVAIFATLSVGIPLLVMALGSLQRI